MRIQAIRVDMSVLILLTLLTLAASTEVDNLNILLPEHRQSPPIPPLQLISAQTGCYQWTSSQSDIIKLQSYQSTSAGCSRQAVVSVSQLGPVTSTIYLTAKDTASQAQLKIPVRIRKVNKITIATKSRMMNIKEIQKIELFAFDADGNTFTSLQGMRFQWTLHQQYPIIDTVLIQNAHLYLPLRTREVLQKKGYQTDIIVVRAIAPGNLKVTVTCIEPGYESLFDQITISVHERFELQPGPIIRMATDSSFQLKLVRPNLQEIVLPQSYYRIISCKNFLVNDTLYLSVPNEPSTCTIKVEDTRTKPSYSSSVDIVVSSADQIRIITDSIVIVGRESKYQAQLFSKGTLLMGQNSKIVYRSDFPLDQSRKVLVSDKKGTGRLSAILGSLRAQATINSYLPVAVVLPQDYLHLPVGQHFKLHVIGGTGVYDFQISNDIANINSLSVLHAKAVGDATVTIRDRNHAINQVVVKLKVSHIAQIVSLQETKEVNRDEWGYLYIIGKNAAHQTFTQCLQAQFTLEVPSTKLDIDKKVIFSETVSFLQFHRSQLVQAAIAPTSLLKSKQYSIIAKYDKYVQFSEIDAQQLKNYVLGLQNFGICKPIRFKSILALQQKAVISLQGQENINTKIPLRVYNIISTTIQGDNSIFLMTPQSSLRWTYSGGSYEWPNSKTSASVNGQLVKQGLFPAIACPNKQTPSQTYELKIFNEQTKALLFPTSQISSINLICKFPKKLHLELQHGEGADELYIEATTLVNGIVRATDEYNQLFYNSDNVKYEFHTLTGSIISDEKRFNYQSKGKNDTISIFTEKLYTDLAFKRVQLKLNINLIKPITINHLLAPADGSIKNVTITTLFTPKKPYILNIQQLHPLVSIQCSNAVSCDRGENYIAVKLLKVGRGEVAIRDKRVYASYNWYFQFIIVQADQVRVFGDRDYVQQGEIVYFSIINYYQGQKISPFTYEPSYLQLVSDKNLRVIEQNVNTFAVKVDQAAQYQIYGENTYPKTIRSKQPFVLTVYKQISPNIEDTSTKQEGGLLIIQAKTAIVLGCRRLIRIQGGPRQMQLASHTQSSHIRINQTSHRNLQITSSKQGTFLLSITASLHSNKIALILVTITASLIQSVQLQSIDQPVAGANFRIHPKFKIGNSNLEQSICDFQYHWKETKGYVRLGESVSFGLLQGAGINATAIVPGHQIIHFEVVQKHSKKLLLKQSKEIQILQQFGLQLPTYINRPSCCQTSSIIIPPNTKYSFTQGVVLKVQEGVVHLGQHNNILQSDNKLGHSTITLTQNGHRSLHLQVEVKHVMGIFIQNQDGFINIDPYSQLAIPLYLQDNNGRLFITPLQNLDILVTSSNDEILQAKLDKDGNHLLIKSYEHGICVLSVILPNRNIVDSIVVSIGSALSPSRFVRILNNGVIQYSGSLPLGKWTSSNPQIASIDQKTGLAKARSVGTTKIHYGQFSSTIEVVKVALVRQVGQERYKGSSLQIQYQVLWQGKNGLEEISHIRSNGPVNNNLGLTCNPNNKQLTSNSSLIFNENHQRLVCSISPKKDEKWPSSIILSIHDSSNQKLSEFSYEFKPHFTVDKKTIKLSSKSPSASISISSPTVVNVQMRNGQSKWVLSHYDQNLKQQRITINMGDHQSETVWWLDLQSGGQEQQIKVIFGRESAEEHSFWSFNLDWPDYLIIVMAGVFGFICYVQYTTDQRLKQN